MNKTQNKSCKIIEDLSEILEMVKAADAAAIAETVKNTLESILAVL